MRANRQIYIDTSSLIWHLRGIIFLLAGILEPSRLDSTASLRGLLRRRSFHSASPPAHPSSRTSLKTLSVAIVMWFTTPVTSGMARNVPTPVHRRGRIVFLSAELLTGLFKSTVSLWAAYATASHPSRPRSFKICSCFCRWCCSVASTINPSATNLYSHCI